MRRVGEHVGGGREPESERGARERKEAFREALSFWSTGVAILAVREPTGTVHGLTVGSFIPVSVDPPLVLASLGPNASALPYLQVGGEFAVSILGDHQKGLASRYSDTFPVGPSPFPESGPPRVKDALASLVCEVDEMMERGDATLVIGRVLDASTGEERGALGHYRRDYHGIG